MNVLMKLCRNNRWSIEEFGTVMEAVYFAFYLYRTENSLPEYIHNFDTGHRYDLEDIKKMWENVGLRR